MEAAKIYFDMDDVLADFDRGVRELCGMEPSDKDHPDPAEETEMWKRIREAGHFYDKLELMPGAKEMFDRIRGRYGDRCEILTGIPKPKWGIDTAAEDKMNWTRRLLSGDVTVNAVQKKEKRNYSGEKSRILIDDMEGNIRSWEESGGTGILHKSAAETLKTLEDMGVL